MCIAMKVFAQVIGGCDWFVLVTAFSLTKGFDHVGGVHWGIVVCSDGICCGWEIICVVIHHMWVVVIVISVGILWWSEVGIDPIVVVRIICFF